MMTLISPEQLKQRYPLHDPLRTQIKTFRSEIAQIVKGKASRLLVICGPCSIHDPVAAIEYAQRLKALSRQLEDRLFIVMRVYFEKPRTTLGWKGAINDPDMNGSFNIEKGLIQARQLLLNIAQLGVPIATETLDINTPLYFNDLISWAAIGARTTESQIHREMASGFAFPVGFKNGTDGNLKIAIDAMHSCAAPHHFLGVNEAGQMAHCKTQGNSATHLILRGGIHPNYNATHVRAAHQLLSDQRLNAKVMVDCSHGNSEKNHKNQKKVIYSVIEQLTHSSRAILGVMLESHLNAGAQPILAHKRDLKYGVSVTDACIDWQETETLLMQLADSVPI